MGDDSIDMGDDSIDMGYLVTLKPASTMAYSRSTPPRYTQPMHTASMMPVRMV